MRISQIDAGQLDKGTVTAEANQAHRAISVFKCKQWLNMPLCAMYSPQGSERQDDFIHIFLEFVPGGSIANLLTRFGAPLVPWQSHLPARVEPLRCAAGSRFAIFLCVKEFVFLHS